MRQTKKPERDQRGLIAGLVLVSLTLASALNAGAANVTDKAHYFQHAPLSGWKAVSRAATAESDTRVLARYQGPEGTDALVLHAKFPNRRAWRKRAEFFAEVEAGVRDASPGYRRLRKKRGRLGRVPYLDLSFTRTRGKAKREVHARFLFFRTFSVSIALSAPSDAPSKLRRRLASLRATFKPYFGK